MQRSPSFPVQETLLITIRWHVYKPYIIGSASLYGIEEIKMNSIPLERKSLEKDSITLVK
jgi:hypothetical protein